MGEAEEQRGQKLLQGRLRAMGIETRPVPGGRALVGELHLRPAPFPTPAGPREVARLRFATVGPQHLKCLRPRAFFHLPLIGIGGCASAASVEDRIRAAWSRQVETLRATLTRLEETEATWSLEDDGAVLSLPLEGCDGARARLASLRRIALPSAGPLAGLRLPRAADRLFEAPRDFESGIDLELAVTTRLEELARRADREETRRRLHLPELEPAAPEPAVLTPTLVAQADSAARRVLLVGPAMLRDPALSQALHVRGYQVVQARSAQEGLQAFTRASFDVVLVDAELGREEGVELVPAIHTLPGVCSVPVVLVDDRMRPARREAARQAGAAGYLARPVDLGRIAPGLARMVAGHRGRRFDRFPLRLGVRFEEGAASGVTLEVSRRGMFVRTERPSREGALERVGIALPGRSGGVPVEARTVYRIDASGAREAGLGLGVVRFVRLEDEADWIALLADARGDAAA